MLSRPGSRLLPIIDPPKTLYVLACSLLYRWDKSKEPDDIKYCIKYFRFLRDQQFQTVPERLTSRLVSALATQVESMLPAGNVTEYIEEMVILCHELLDSDSSESPQTVDLAASKLTKAVLSNYNFTREFRDQAIEFLREANIRFPKSSECSRCLADCLAMRFMKTLENDDYEEAVTSLKRALVSTVDLPEDSWRNFLQQNVLKKIASISHVRYAVSGKPDHAEEAISHIHTYQRSIPRDHPDHPQLSKQLENLADSRVHPFQNVGIWRGPGTVDISTISSLTASLTEPNPLPISHKQGLRHAQALYTISTSAEIAENEEAIKYCRQLVASIRRDPCPMLEFVAPLAFMTLGFQNIYAFWSTNKIECLDESIAAYRDGLKMDGSGFYRQTITTLLSAALSHRLAVLQRGEDLDEAIELHLQIANNKYSTISQQLQLSCQWADVAHRFMHFTTAAAYERALSLMQDSLSYAPTLETQHSRLFSARNIYEKLPRNYASYQIHTGQLNGAIETLERGRALLWSEMHGFRTSADRLAAVDSALAEEFVAINSELEQVTTSMVPYGVIKRRDKEVEDLNKIDSFGRLVVRQQELLENRDKLISRIRGLPDLGSFLRPPLFEDLRSAASHGPVIVINHCKRRSDILILLHDSPPSLITTANDFYDRAIELSDQLVKARKDHLLESEHYLRTLRFVLRTLYDLVGQPVIEEFRKLKIPEQSRVWWCPTSVFCHLPLHAMGPIPSEDGKTRHFLDLYIPSYTPTLSTLITSRKYGPEGKALGKPSIVLIAQPESLLYATPEILSIQRLNTTITSLISSEATPSSVVEGLKYHQFSHFVCHGNLEPGKPFNASFQLYGGKRLTLLDIVHSQLPTAEFAFLSACHTAEVTDDSIADEALHLAAAMQYCGFRSVVGTMWAMADKDGYILVEHFYKSLLSSDEPSVPYYERSARALRDAVKNLRREGASLERWVNYVHFGA
jgi:CHAT domain-containing protein